MNKIDFAFPAKYFEEAFPVGNGFFGGMYYADGERGKISLNLDSLWSGNDKNKGKGFAADKLDLVRSAAKEGKIGKTAKLLKEYFYGDDSEAYVPLGNLYIKSEKAERDGYRRELDLERAVASASYSEGATEVKEECFCSNPHMVLAVKIESKKNDLTRTIDFEPAQYCEKSYKNDEIIFCGRCPDQCYPVTFASGEGTIRYFCSIKIKTDGKSQIDGGIKITEASFIEIYFSGTTTFYDLNANEEKICAVTDRATEFGFENLKREHIEDYRRLYCRSSLSISGDDTADKSETLFNFGKYLLISSSRAGSMPANLQGIWSESLEPIWKCGYTMNINLQMNYWGAEQAGLGECVKPLISFVSRLKTSGEKTAKEMFGTDGWCAFHNSDIWNMTTPVGNTHESDPSQYAWFMGAAGWLCLPLYEHFQFTKDKEYLRNVAMPVIEGAVKFYLGNLEEYNGSLTVIPSASPENTYTKLGRKCALCCGSTMDNSIIEGLLRSYIDCCGELEIKGELYDKAEKALEKLRKPQIGSDGRILEWDKEYKESEVKHRHISHLYFNHPAALNFNGEYDEAIKKSLAVRGHGGTGWSIAWKANQYARLHDGENALALIERHLNPVEPSASLDYSNGGGTYPNYFCAHPPFQIDGNFGIMAAIGEMLMQSNYGFIDILPALPKSWKSGKVKGMRAKGGYKVSFDFSGGKVTRLKIDHESEKECLVMVNGKKQSVRTNELICFTD